jgi:hypothetical protein
VSDASGASCAPVVWEGAPLAVVSSFMCLSPPR